MFDYRKWRILLLSLATRFLFKIKIMENKRLPVPPFTKETALQKVQAAEDAWNSKDPERVSLAYTIDNEWRNRSEFLKGRSEVKQFLTRKWQKELDYRFKKELWAFTENRIGVHFEYEWHDSAGQWFRRFSIKDGKNSPLKRLLLGRGKVPVVVFSANP
jgi:uncharacterized protein